VREWQVDLTNQRADIQKIIRNLSMSSFGCQHAQERGRSLTEDSYILRCICTLLVLAVFIVLKGVDDSQL
jgi:hypothetical protein